VIYGVYSTVGGLVMLFAPGFMFENIGGFGVFNGHYIFDLASFELPLGLMYLAPSDGRAGGCRRWRSPRRTTRCTRSAI